MGGEGWAEDEEGVADEGDDHTLGGMTRETTLTQCLAPLETTQDETYGTEHEVSASATCDAEGLLAIDGEVVAEDTEAETEGHHVDTEEPATEEEEAVPREWRVDIEH